MKASELRIGNYYYQFGNVHKASGLTIIDLEKAPDSQLWRKPIPLTEEWLLKFGAHSRFENSEFIYDRFRLIWKESYKYWYVIDSESLSYLTKIEFVHEWQNFIFVVNDVELKINL